MEGITDVLNDGGPCVSVWDGLNVQIEPRLSLLIHAFTAWKRRRAQQLQCNQQRMQPVPRPLMSERCWRLIGRLEDVNGGK